MAPVDSQTSTEYGSLPAGVSTTPTQMIYGFFPSKGPSTATQGMNYRSFPEGLAEIMEKAMDHEDAKPVGQEDDTMMEVGGIDKQELMGEEDSDSLPLTFLESTPKQLPRRPMDMFNQPGGSIIAHRYYQKVGIPQTKNILPPGLCTGKGGHNDQSQSDNSDEELASPSAQAAQSKKEAVNNKPVSRLLYTPQKNKPTHNIEEG
ncbi:hypothetical protein BDD12DRAFT_894656 [Trichophaea hybrida]|nr:hypothetical protein BDD12DRAFT_894656 [Trichophaea hybrida]